MSEHQGTSSDSAGRGWRLIGEELRRQKWGIFVGILAGLAWTAAKVSVPKLVEAAIDNGIETGDRGAVTRFAWILAGAAMAAALFTGVRRYIAFREARLTEAVLRDRLFAHLCR